AKSTPASDFGNPFMFTGRRWDEVLGLYDYRTRYYDPALGRFLRIDTIGPWGDVSNFGNPYSYVANNPWSHTDPYGLATQEETVAAFRALYGAEGEHIADVFKAAGGSMQIQDRWFWQSLWSFDHDSKAVTIDSSLDPVASAQAAFAALSQAFTYSDVNQYFLDSPDDFSRYSAARQSAVGESFRIAEQGAQFYISGIGVMNEGADWAIAIEDLSQGRRESILAMAPFISVFMLKGGRILIKEGDEVVDVIGQGAITDPARLLPAPKARSPFHHVFPQRPDLAKRFTDLGIDPNQFTMQIPKSLHDAIHSRGSRGGAWNRAWSSFFELYPDASAEDVYREAGRLIYEFQLPGGPVVPYPR
ncbi:MAG: TIGR02269 family lipoprotein, partial [Candidatus Hydrogenedentes bacterium]|nr:TIGR02269 family lipoprotein [Candidatus Hydrogenedentota bacterium]